MTATVTQGEVLVLLADQLRGVLGQPDLVVDAGTRFSEDLAADSLDLVEVVEAVERVLRDRGWRVALPDGELVAVRTVGDAARRLAAAATPR